MSRPSTTIARGPSGFPDRLFVKLKYCERVSLAHAAGIATEYVMSGNSLYDPRTAVGGHQPYAFDQWSAFYRYYTVHGSAIKVQLINTTIVNNPMDMAVVPSPINTIVTADISSPVEEMPYCKYKIAQVYTSGTNSCMVRNYMSTAKIWGVKPVAIDAEDTYGASTSSNPVNEWWWIIVTQPTDETTAITSHAIIELTYYAEFNTRRELAQS